MTDEDLWAKSQPKHLKKARNFPGGTHGYWLHVKEILDHLDVIYSTPVMVTTEP